MKTVLGLGRQIKKQVKFISKIQKHIDIFEYFKMLTDVKTRICLE